MNHRKFLSFLFLFLIFCTIALNHEGNAYSSSEKVWILFQDRIAVPAQARISPDPNIFTRSAIVRRMRRAEVPFDASDLPVQKDYVDAVRRAGAAVLVESRWLHGVSARCNAACQENVRQLDFVREVRPVVTFRRPHEPITTVEYGGPHIAALKYGQSKEQLTQIGVPPAHRKGFAGQGEIVAIFDGGFRKDHIAFRNQEVLAEKDFVFGDDNVTNGGTTDTHGTAVWSLVGGEAPGKLFGVAYRAQFLLAATEDIRGETEVEEDNWVAGFEWADRLGASVISSSLGYSNWYVPSDYDGTTAITSRVVSMAAQKGIVVVNSAGNSGPGSSTLSAPADAKKMLAVGAVNFLGNIADFSSRGPTADGRIKPEIVARGVNNYLATSNTQNSFGRANGTSFSCPLVAGAAAALLSAHPDWTPVQVREALMETASQADNPDNTFGSGIINLSAASEYLPKKSVVIDEHKPLKDTANKTQPYRITARIRAQRGINPNQSFLVWKKEGTALQQVLFRPVAGKTDVYEAFIPPQSQGSTIQYYLTARDVKGKKTSVPLGSPAVTFSFKIL